MYKTLVATSIFALVAAAPALAQSSGGGTGASPSAPSSGGSQKDAPSSQQKAPSAQEKSPSAQEKTTSGQKDAQDRGKEPSKEKQKASDSDRSKGDRDKSATGTKEQPKTDRAADKEDQKGTSAKEKSKSDMATGKATEKGSDAKDGKSARGGARHSGVKVSISAEQRQKVQSVFVKHRSEAKVNIDVDVKVGTKVPRTVKLVAIPQDILVIVPEYREYRYFIVEEKVVIVDPDTLEVVEIIIIS
jgi:hypothetical protein